MPPRSLRVGSGDVRVWYAPTSDLSARGADGLAATWLTPLERGRYARVRGDDDRQMFLLGRIMARTLVGAALGLGPSAWQWREGPHGRPEIDAPATDLRFSLAHSAGLVACALARGRDVGVDVEDRERRPVAPLVAHRYCSPAEVADIERSGDGWHDRFLRYWTLKEAYLKARGLGISVPLAEMTFHLDADRARITFDGSLRESDDRWLFRLTQPTPRHVLAVAASLAAGDLPSPTVERLSDYLP